MLLALITALALRRAQEIDQGLSGLDIFGTSMIAAKNTMVSEITGARTDDLDTGDRIQHLNCLDANFATPFATRTPALLPGFARIVLVFISLAIPTRSSTLAK